MAVTHESILLQYGQNIYMKKKKMLFYFGCVKKRETIRPRTV